MDLDWTTVYLTALGVCGVAAMILVLARAVRRRVRPTPTDLEVRETRSRWPRTTGAAGTGMWGGDPGGDGS